MANLLDFFSRDRGVQRTQRLRDLLNYYIPPNTRDPLAALAGVTPSASLAEGGAGFKEALSPTASVSQRVAGVGKGLTGTAGVAAPMLVANKAGLTAAEAIQDSLLGFSQGANYAGQKVLERANQRGPMPTVYSNPVVPNLSSKSGITAYHGSPHSFDKFDISKIGSGEGAQAYGYGLYFAENEKVARDYRDALTEGLRLQGKPLDTVWTDEIRERWPDLYKGLSESDADTMDALIGTMEGVGSIQDAESAAQSVSRGAERLLETRVKPLLGEAPAGSMYEVKLPFEKSDLLDYDKPVSKQPKILSKIDDKYGDPEIIASQLGLDFETATGGAWLQQLEGLGLDTESKKAASDWFKGAGIEGIKYFDQGSRNTADGKSLGVAETADGFVGRVEGSVPSVFGPNSPQRVLTKSKPYKTKEEAENWINEAINRQTSNYVVFDDKMIDIVRKYGIAGAAAMLGISTADVQGALAQEQGAQSQRGLLD